MATQNNLLLLGDLQRSSVEQTETRNIHLSLKGCATVPRTHQALIDNGGGGAQGDSIALFQCVLGGAAAAQPLALVEAFSS